MWSLQAIPVYPLLFKEEEIQLLGEVDFPTKRAQQISPHRVPVAAVPDMSYDEKTPWQAKNMMNELFLWPGNALRSTRKVFELCPGNKKKSLYCSA